MGLLVVVVSMVRIFRYRKSVSAHKMDAPESTFSDGACDAHKVDVEADSDNEPSRLSTPVLEFTID